jgi:hypothetical protein
MNGGNQILLNALSPDQLVDLLRPMIRKSTPPPVALLPYHCITPPKGVQYANNQTPPIRTHHRH